MTRAVGVDVGGTWLRTGVVEGGRLGPVLQLDAPVGSYPSLLDAIEAAVTQLAGPAAAPSSPVPVGVGIAAWLSPDRERVARSAHLGWNDRGLRADLEARLGRPVTVVNDADAAAWGAFITDGRPAGTRVTLTLGTDVGGGVILDGHLLTGAHGIAGELGHLVVDPAGPQCVCGAQGCLAVYASGRALRREHRSSELAEAARAIAAASAIISRVIDHDTLVLAGGVSRIGVPLRDAVHAALEASTPIGPVRPMPRVVVAADPCWVGTLGAGDLASHAVGPTSPAGSPAPHPEVSRKERAT